MLLTVPFVLFSLFLFMLYLFSQSFCTTSMYEADKKRITDKFRRQVWILDKKFCLWEGKTLLEKKCLLTKGAYSCCCLVSEQSGLQLANRAAQSGLTKDAESVSFLVRCPDTDGSCREQGCCCIYWKIQDILSGSGLSECWSRGLSSWPVHSRAWELGVDHVPSIDTVALAPGKTNYSFGGQKGAKLLELK